MLNFILKPVILSPTPLHLLSLEQHQTVRNQGLKPCLMQPPSLNSKHTRSSDSVLVEFNKTEHRCLQAQSPSLGPPHHSLPSVGLNPSYAQLSLTPYS